MIYSVLDRIKPTETSVVFDLGCGDARWLITASKKYSCSCVGIELDGALVKKAQQTVVDEKVCLASPFAAADTITTVRGTASTFSDSQARGRLWGGFIHCYSGGRLCIREGNCLCDLFIRVSKSESMQAIERIKEMLTSQLKPGSRIISVGVSVKQIQCLILIHCALVSD